MLELLPPRERAMDDRPFAPGLYRDDFRDLNLEELPQSAETTGPRDLYRRFVRMMRGLRIKRWQHFAFASDRHWVSLALCDIGYATNTWLSVFHLETGEHAERSFLLPGKWGHAARNFFTDSSELHLPFGYLNLDLHNRLGVGHHDVSFRTKATGKTPLVEGHLTAYESPNLVQPLIVLKEFSANRPFYTHKVPCPIEGSLTVRNETVSLTKTKHCGLFDNHAAYYPHHALWKWVTFGAIDDRGQPFGLNITTGTAWPEGDRPNENAIWYRGTLTPLSDASVEIPKDPNDPWKVTTTDDRVSLEFKPLFTRRADHNVGLVQSTYCQPVGRFYGTIKPMDCDPVSIDGLLGCTEDHIAKW